MRRPRLSAERPAASAPKLRCWLVSPTVTGNFATGEAEWCFLAADQMHWYLRRAGFVHDPGRVGFVTERQQIDGPAGGVLSPAEKPA